MNPVIKFTTLFGLLAVELAVTLDAGDLSRILAGVFFALSMVFVYRSFYGMRIKSDAPAATEPAAKAAQAAK